MFQNESDCDADDKAGQDRADQIEQQARLRRDGRYVGGIDHSDIVGTDAPRNADFLVALQKAVIELAICIRLALIDVVLDRTAALIDEARFEHVHSLRQLGHALFRSLVISGQRFTDPRFFPGNTAIQLRDL